MAVRTSSRLIRKDIRKTLSIWRVPGDGPVIPRLRTAEPKDAIGFCATHLPGQQSDDTVYQRLNLGKLD